MKNKALIVFLVVLNLAVLLLAGPSITSVYQGGTGLGAVAAHQVFVGTASNVFTAKTIPDCQDSSGNHLNYTQSGDSFNCGTSSSGGGGGALTKISQVVTSGSATSVTFSSIPGTYSNLILQVQVRSQGSGTGGESVYMEINGDTGGHYTGISDYSVWVPTTDAFGGSGWLNASNASNYIFVAETSGCPTNSASVYTATFINYAGTTFAKLWHSEGFYADNNGSGSSIRPVNSRGSGNWASTSAITTLLFTLPSSHAFVDGSTFTLYGQS